MNCNDVFEKIENNQLINIELHKDQFFQLYIENGHKPNSIISAEMRPNNIKINGFALSDIVDLMADVKEDETKEKIDDLENEIIDLENEIDSLNSDLSGKDTEIEDLESEIEELNDKLLAFERKDGDSK